MSEDNRIVQTRVPGRRPVVGVMGSGLSQQQRLCDPLGRYLAGLGVHLLTGGGAGSMEAVTRAFVADSERTGLAIGILPGDAQGQAPDGYPNPWVELVIRSHLPARGSQGAADDSRNHLNVLSADVVIALPGGAGTRSEVDLCRRYGRPVLLHGWSPPLPEDLGELPRTTDLEALDRWLRPRLEATAAPSARN